MPNVLPLFPSIPNYRFGTALNSVQYLVDIRWNGRESACYMDIFAEDESPIRRGMKIVLGTLLGGRSADPRFPGVLIASDLSGEGRDAGLDDLGTRVAVYLYSEEDLAAE
jgi:hypothetical protein